MNSTYGIGIIGNGHYVPDNLITNEMLEEWTGVPASSIETRIGGFPPSAPGRVCGIPLMCSLQPIFKTDGKSNPFFHNSKGKDGRILGL